MIIKNAQAPIIFLMGPTASGKTALAIDLCQQENSPFEIISVDSAMVYTQMNIGTAKPSDKELVLAPHHLIDFIDPKQRYSSSQFCEDASQIINEIHQRGHIPLLTGGTMLYFKSLKEGLSDLPATDESIRLQVKKDFESKGLEALYTELQSIDPISATRLHQNDNQRITRAVEVFRMTGKPLSQWHEEQKKYALANPLMSIALAPLDRQVLHQRIALRFEQMIEQGFLDEVAQLYYRGDLDLNCPSIRSVGYRQIWQYMDGELSLSEAKERAVIATRQLAKRQYTWLRSWPNINWFDSLDLKEVARCKQDINHFVENNM